MFRDAGGNLVATDPTIGYFEAAAAGSTDAYAGLREAALTAGERGEVSRTESIVAAECFGRLAASAGDPVHVHRLVTILLARGHDRSARGYVATFFRQEAAHYLQALADSGDEAAAGELDLLDAERDWVADPSREVTRQSVAQTHADAARGDLAALDCMVSVLVDGRDEPDGFTAFDRLVSAEQYARLGAYSGSPHLAVKLAGVLWLRYSYEQNIGGDLRRGLAAAVEGFHILADLEAQTPGIRSLLEAAVAEVRSADLALFVTHAPALLAHLKSEGSA